MWWQLILTHHTAWTMINHRCLVTIDHCNRCLINLSPLYGKNMGGISKNYRKFWEKSSTVSGKPVKIWTVFSIWSAKLPSIFRKNTFWLIFGNFQVFWRQLLRRMEQGTKYWFENLKFALIFSRMAFFHFFPEVYFLKACFERITNRKRLQFFFPESIITASFSEKKKFVKISFGCRVGHEFIFRFNYPHHGTTHVSAISGLSDLGNSLKNSFCVKDLTFEKISVEKILRLFCFPN